MTKSRNTLPAFFSRTKPVSIQMLPLTRRRVFETAASCYDLVQMFAIEPSSLAEKEKRADATISHSETPNTTHSSTRKRLTKVPIGLRLLADTCCRSEYGDVPKALIYMRLIADRTKKAILVQTPVGR